METIARIIPYVQVGDAQAAQSARQALISRCLLARAAAPVDDFDAQAAMDEGRD